MNLVIQIEEKQDMVRQGLDMELKLNIKPVTKHKNIRRYENSNRSI